MSRRIKGTVPDGHLLHGAPLLPVGAKDMVGGRRRNGKEVYEEEEKLDYKEEEEGGDDEEFLRFSVMEDAILAVSPRRPPTRVIGRTDDPVWTYTCIGWI
ncbi:hypothetical protein ABZP36_010196 [Zizania latifolia]